MDIEKLIQQGQGILTQWGLKVVGVLVALFIAWIIAGFVQRVVRRSLTKVNFDATLTRFFASCARYFILAGAVLGCLGVFGVDTTSFAGLIAAGGLAIGLAFQGTLSNFAAGVMLLVFRPFKVGDLVTVAGITGVVENIDLFTCDFKTLDNRRIIVPNGQIFGATIDNITHYPLRRVDVDVGCDYGADIDASREALARAISKVPDALTDPKPQVFLASLGASSVDWQLRVWCNTNDYWDVYQATIQAAKAELDADNIGIPFPQMDVHFDPEIVKAISK